VQGFSPDGTLSVAVTALKSSTVDISNSIAFGLYCAPFTSTQGKGVMYLALRSL
jgi:hypothetical protein